MRHILIPHLSHCRVVAQLGSWLVMEPVSHLASINLAPPSTNPHPRLTKGLRESVRGVGRWGSWMGKEPNENHILSSRYRGLQSSWNTHRCTGLYADIYRCMCTHPQTHTHKAAHRWSSHRTGISTMTSMWNLMICVIVAVPIFHQVHGRRFPKKMRSVFQK